MSGSNNSIRPENVLSDNENIADINGVPVRKGSIAAFLKNVELLEMQDLSSDDRDNILSTMKELAPALVAAGLHKYAIFKNPVVQEILDAEFNNSSRL